MRSTSCIVPDCSGGFILVEDRGWSKTFVGCDTCHPNWGLVEVRDGRAIGEMKHAGNSAGNGAPERFSNGTGRRDSMEVGNGRR